METITTIHASHSAAQSASVSKGKLWTGRILSGLPALFLLVDAVGKFIKPAPVVEGTLQLGYPESVILGLGIVLLTCTVLYIIPRTAILGAILLTGYRRRGRYSRTRGKSALHHILFPVYLPCSFGAGFICATNACARSFLCGVSSPQTAAPAHRPSVRKQDVLNKLLHSSER